MEAYFKTQFPSGSGQRLQQTIALMKKLYPEELVLIKELSNRLNTLEKEDSDAELARARFRMMLREIVWQGGIPRQKITLAMHDEYKTNTSIVNTEGLYDD